MKILKVVAFLTWACFSAVVFTAAFAGWKGALYPPTYMADEYVWRVMGGAILGTLFPLFSLVGLFFYVRWCGGGKSEL